jgi:peptidoglycan-N-acetylglucosamine deacetylase
MRLVAAASALAILVCVAVAGAVLAQRTTAPAPVPVLATSIPAAAPAPLVAVKEVADHTVGAGSGVARSAAPAVLPEPTVVAQAAPQAAKPVAPAPVPLVQAQAAPPAPAAPPKPAASSCPGNPNALGIARTLEIDTTGGPGFGFEHFKSHDFLREGEVVLTFDDGPWPKNTLAVLNALNAHCTKAIFFPIGTHAIYEPSILKQVAAAGNAIGSHTWCHQDLSKTKGSCVFRGKREAVEYDPKDEIEKGISAVRWAVGGPTAPYFRFPALRQPPELIAYLGTRNIGIFSTDFDSFDFKMRKPEEVRKAVMAKLKKHGKGIALMHDFQQATAGAAMDLLNDLKAGGYKIVHMKPKFPITTIASYDEVVKKLSGPEASGPPTSSVIREISQ